MPSLTSCLRSASRWLLSNSCGMASKNASSFSACSGGKGGCLVLKVKLLPTPPSTVQPYRDKAIASLVEALKDVLGLISRGWRSDKALVEAEENREMSLASQHPDRIAVRVGRAGKGREEMKISKQNKAKNNLAPQPRTVDSSSSCPRCSSGGPPQGSGSRCCTALALLAVLQQEYIIDVS